MNNHPMKVSIITATFNSSSTIGDCINSVYEQTYSDIEHIIIDGNSKDDTLALINTIPNHVSKIVSEKDKGIYDAMNKGIALASGDIVGILNSDDLYYDNTVLTQVMHEFNMNPSLDILYGDLVYVKQTDTNKIVRKWNSVSYYPQFFDNGNVPPHPSLFLRKKVYSQAGLFNTKYELAADYEFMLRVFKKFNFSSKHIKSILVRMRLGGATNKSLWNIYKGNREIFLAWKSNDLIVPLAFLPLKFYKRLIQFF